MMKKIASVLIVMLLATYLLFGQEDDCEKIRVGIYFEELSDDALNHLNEKYGSKTRDAWIEDIENRLVQTLQNNSPELEIFSMWREPNKDPHYLFRYLLSLSVIETDLLVPSIANSYEDPMTGWPVTEYSDPIYKEETAFWNAGSLIINSPCQPNLRYYVAVELKADLELDGAIAKLSQGLWRLTNFIEESEDERPVPARGPDMEIEFEKDYLSILEKEDRELEVKVKVKNCEGEYLYRKVRSQPVYFPKDVNRCEYEQVRGCIHNGNYGNHEIVLTNAEYESKGKYKVIEGIEASIEKVNLGTCGIGGSSEIWVERELIIRGLDLKVRPNRRQIFCDERTEIKLTFNETDTEGNEYPVEGKDLDVKITGRINGSLKAKNGYTTDDNGEVILVYTAGSEDRNIRITASFQPEDYPEKVEGKGSITVKSVEYDAMVNIRKTYNKILRTSDENKRDDEAKSHNIDESIEASASIFLTLIETQDMPVLNQTWQYFKPISVTVSSISYNSIENKYSSSKYHQTSVDYNRMVKDQKLDGEETVKQLPWMLVIDNETKKAVKLIPAGYSITYEIFESEVIKSVIITSEGTEYDSETITRNKSKSFGIGPVADEIPDPTIKTSDTWIQDYLKKQGVELPPGVPIPNISNEETIKKIHPDILVKYGDGTSSFGGDGDRLIETEFENGKQEERLHYSWNMTRSRKNQ